MKNNYFTQQYLLNKSYKTCEVACKIVFINIFTENIYLFFLLHTLFPINCIVPSYLGFVIHWKWQKNLSWQEQTIV